MIREKEEKSEITAILHKYKDTLYDLIDSLDIESLDWLDFPNWSKLIDKGLRNTSKFRGGSPNFLEEN